MNILVLMAGSSSEFYNQGYLYPKYLTEVQGKPLIEHVIASIKTLTGANFIFCLLKEDCQRFHLDKVVSLLVPSAKIIQVENMTKGAACTAMLAVKHIDNEEDLLIVNGDQIIDLDLRLSIEHFKNMELDGGIITFDSVHPRWSYVRLDNENMVVEAAEKRPISKHATAGAYYFKEGKKFIEAAKLMIEKDANVGGLYFVCPVYNEMILNQDKISIYNIPREKYLSVSSPEGVKSFANYLGKKEGTTL